MKPWNCGHSGTVSRSAPILFDFNREQVTCVGVRICRKCIKKSHETRELRPFRNGFPIHSHFD